MRAVISLGANIGNPKEQMDLAVAMLREATDVIAVSTYIALLQSAVRLNQIFSTRYVLQRVSYQQLTYYRCYTELKSHLVVSEFRDGGRARLI